MMATPDNAKLAKLPAWARDYINVLELEVHHKESQRQEAVAAMYGKLQSQEPTRFYVDDWVDVASGGPRPIRTYLDIHEVTCEHGGVCLTISTIGSNIQASFNETRGFAGSVLIKPCVSNVIEFVRERE